MNTAELVDHIVDKDGKLTKGQAKAIVNGVFAAIRDAAVKGEEVSLPGFGKFKVQDKPARTGRNPRTGESVSIAASKKLAFPTGESPEGRARGLTSILPAFGRAGAQKTTSARTAGFPVQTDLIS